MMSTTKTPNELAETGQRSYHKADYEAAAGFFQAAETGFKLAGEALLAAEQANNRSVAWLQAGNAAQALEAVQGTAEVFAAGGDVRRQAMAIGNRGAALEALGHLEEAAKAYQESADLLKQAGELELRAHVMQSLSMLQLRAGDRLQAYATMLAGVEGIPHPKPRQRLLKRLMRLPFKFFNIPE